MNYKDLGAFLFVKTNMDDPNAEISVEDAALLGVRFLTACQEVLATLHDQMTEEEIQWHMYEIGKKHYGIDKKILREWFKHLYLLLFGDESGSRWGTWIIMFGVDSFKNMLTRRLDDPFYLKVIHGN